MIKIMTATKFVVCVIKQDVKKRVLFIYLFLFVGLTSCQKRKAAPIIVKQEVEIPPLPVEKKDLIEDPNGIVPLLYFVPVLNVIDRDCGDEKREPIKNIRGQTLVEVCESDFKLCLSQGTCLLNEKGGMRMINFTTRRGKVPLFTDKIKKECPYGLGLKDICLDPYYTVAADLNFHKLGDVIFVPSVRGITLPNGDIHDGYFVVRDSGSNLKEDVRFDFFTGFEDIKSENNVFRKLGLYTKDNRFRFQKVTDENATKVRVKRNYPKLTKKQVAEASSFFKKAMAETTLLLSHSETDIP